MLLRIAATAALDLTGVIAGLAVAIGHRHGDILYGRARTSNDRDTAAAATRQRRRSPLKRIRTGAPVHVGMTLVSIPSQVKTVNTDTENGARYGRTMSHRCWQSESDECKYG